MLTYKQIEEGWRIIARDKVGHDEGAAAGWLRANAEALLEAAERCAQRTVSEAIFAAQPPSEQEQLFVAEAERLTNERRAQARSRFEEIREACAAAFHLRPLVADNQQATNPHAFQPRDVAAWLRDHGLWARAYIDPGSKKQILIDPIEVIPSGAWRPGDSR